MGPISRLGNSVHVVCKSSPSLLGGLKQVTTLKFRIGLLQEPVADFTVSFRSGHKFTSGSVGTVHGVIETHTDIGTQRVFVAMGASWP